MYSIARKDHLCKNLTKLMKEFPTKFNFFPKTWLLPSEYGDFRAQFNKKGNKTFILKPEADSQGRGIFLVKKIDDVPDFEHFVAQKYISNPLILEELKFDLRIYVLLLG